MTPPETEPSYEDYAQQLDKAYGVLGSHDYFQSARIERLGRIVAELEKARGRLSILEIGSGLGTSLRALSKKHMAVGVEPDVNLLAQANDKATLELVQASGGCTPFAESTFDLIYMINVLHHMGADTAKRTLEEAQRTLKPGGKLVVFEHNAYNLPVCLFLKALVAIDRNASFYTPARARRSVRRARLSPDQLIYICFFPRVLRFLRWAERYLSWLPLGGGYCLIASKD